MFCDLEPWTAADAYAEEDWTKVITVARHVQESKPAEVERALKQFVRCAALMDADVPDFEYLNGSKIMLLLRVVFEYPEERVDQSRRTSGVWLGRGSGTHRSVGWPVSWRKGRPELIDDYRGYSGAAYDPVSEYRAALKRYPFRKLRDPKETAAGL